VALCLVVRGRKREEKMAIYKKNTCVQFLGQKKRDEGKKSLSLYFYLLMAAVLVVHFLLDWLLDFVLILHLDILAAVHLADYRLHLYSLQGLS
jgi:Flp pilus assembly protein TadB